MQQPSILRRRERPLADHRNTRLAQTIRDCEREAGRHDRVAHAQIATRVRPYLPVHRLDLETSGVLLVARRALDFEGMVMVGPGPMLFPVAAGPVRGPRYARLLQDPAGVSSGTSEETLEDDG